MYDDVLLPTDGSAGAEIAIDHAIHTAVQNDAVVHAVHVLEVTELGDLTGDTGDQEGELRTSAWRLLDPLLEAADEARVESVGEVLEGTAHRELVAYVEDEDIDIVVMGTHGKRGLSRMLLGSTAEKVIRNSPAPVLTVREVAD